MSSITIDTASDATVICTATANNVEISQKAEVLFYGVAGDLTANPQVVDAGIPGDDTEDRPTVSKLTLIMSTDLGDATLDANVTDENLTIDNYTNEHNGTYTWEVNSIEARDIKFTASVGDEVKGDVVVTFKAGQMKPSRSTFVANKESVIANGEENVTLTATLMDKYGNRIENGVNVHVVETNKPPKSHGIDTPVRESNGTYTFEVTSTIATAKGKKRKFQVFEGDGDGLPVAQIVEVEFRPGPVETAKIEPPTGDAGVGADSNITLSVTLLDAYNNGVYDQNITFDVADATESKDQIIMREVNDTDTGIYTIAVSSNIEQNATFKAKYNDNNISGNSNITFKDENFTVTISSDKQIATANGEDVIKVKLVTSPAIHIVDMGKIQLQNIGSAEQSEAQAVAGEAGSYTIDVNSTVAETLTNVQGKVKSKISENNLVLTFIPGPVSKDKSSVKANIVEAPVSDGTVEKDLREIIITLKDKFNNIISEPQVKASDLNLTQINVDNGNTAKRAYLKDDECNLSPESKYVCFVYSKTNQKIEYTVVVKHDAAKGSVENLRLDVNGTRPQILYSAGQPDPDHSTVVANPSTLKVGEESNITITVRDKFDNLLKNETAVTLNCNKDDVNISKVFNEKDGTYTAKIKTTVAGEVICSAEVSKMEITQKAVVTFTHMPTPKDWIITLSPAEQNVTASEDGTIVASVKDIYGNVIKDANISLEADIGSSIASICTTDDNGTCSIIVSDTVLETVVYSAKANGKTPHADSNSAKVHFVANCKTADDISITLSPESQSKFANGSAEAEFTIRVTDKYNNVCPRDAIEVTMSQSGVESNLSDVEYLQDGNYSATATSHELNTTTYTAIVTTTADGTSATSNEVNVIWTQDNGINVAISADKNSSVVGENITITLTITDDSDHLIDPQDANISLTGDASIIQECGSNNTGIFTCIISDTTTEAVTVSSEVTDLNGTAADVNTTEVTFTHGAADINKTIVRADKNSTVVNDQYEDENGEFTIVTVHVEDTYGNKITDFNGATISLNANDTNGSISDIDTSDSENANYTFNVYNTKAEVVEYKAVVDNLEIDDNATIEFTNGVVDADMSDIVIILPSLDNNPNIHSEITLTLDQEADANGIGILISLRDKFDNEVLNIPQESVVVTSVDNIEHLKDVYYRNNQSMPIKVYQYTKPIEEIRFEAHIGSTTINAQAIIHLTPGQPVLEFSKNMLTSEAVDIKNLKDPDYNTDIVAVVTLRDVYNNVNYLRDDFSVELECVYGPDSKYSCNELVTFDSDPVLMEDSTYDGYEYSYTFQVDASITDKKYRNYIFYLYITSKSDGEVKRLLLKNHQ